MSLTNGPPVKHLSNGVNGVSDSSSTKEYDAIVIGAGFGGLRMLYELRKLGLSAKVIEAGTGVGGTWYWNRYPGARTDSEAWVYIMNFSKELKTDWVWTERYPSQKEVLAYLDHVADRFDMRKDIHFRERVLSAHFDEAENIWTTKTSTTATYNSRFLITAVGVLSQGRNPPFKGVTSFNGEWYQTSSWPKEEIDFTGKRVALIGAGATGVQVLPIVAHSAKSVTLFQRTANYVLPGRNHPLTAAQLSEIRRGYDAIWEKSRNQVFGFPMETYGRTFSQIKDPAERQRILDGGWESGGFRFVFETFDDISTNGEANETAAEYVRNKIRTVVKDPKTAEKLCPHYPIMAKRPPLGHFYYEAFNRDNVHLVDLNENPIQEITPNGIRLATGEQNFDLIIYAIGFDAVTGSLRNMDIQGRGSRRLSKEWDQGVKTFLGITVEGFPNMFMISGPQSPFANLPVIIDNTVDWIGRVISHMRDHNYTQIEATKEGQEGWREAVLSCFEKTIMAKSAKEVYSWYVGANIAQKPSEILFYFGGLGPYFQECEKERVSGFPHLKGSTA
jgi:cyclohexanone monooxygenase